MNEFQRAIVCEYTEAIQGVKGKEGRKEVIGGIAKRHNLTMHMINGIIRLGATEGMQRKKGTPMEASPIFEAVDYVEVIEDLRSRTQNLERRFGYILEGISRIIEDGEMMGAHLQNLRKMAGWLRGRDTIENQAPLVTRNKTGQAHRIRF